MKLGTTQILDIMIPIPVGATEQVDLNKQKEIAVTYKKLEEIKANLLEQLGELAQTKVKFDM